MLVNMLRTLARCFLLFTSGATILLFLYKKRLNVFLLSAAKIQLSPEIGNIHSHFFCSAFTSMPHAASMSSPRLRLMVAVMPCALR